MNRPTISVIIPVFNGEITIKETIKSVLNQTFQNFEIIVINDGSQDKTLDIIESFNYPTIKVFSYTNRGPAVSRNRGLDHASGEFITFLDADDLWTPDKLEAQLNALHANPQAAVAYSWTDYINKFGQFLYPDERIAETGDVYAKLLVNNFLHNGSNPLIRRQALQEIGYFDESLWGSEDWDMWLRLAARYPFTVVPYPHNLYRISEYSVSSNIETQAKECLKVIEKAFAQAPDSLQHLKKQSIAKLYQYLTFKVFDSLPNRHRGWLAAQYYWYTISAYPYLLWQRKKLMFVILLKIILWLLLPPQQARLFSKNSGSVLPSEPK